MPANMPLLPNELARRDNGAVQLRGSPMRLRWNLADLASVDGHRLHCIFSCSVAAINESTEIKMLQEVFLGRSASVTVEAVTAHFTPALKSAASRVAGASKAEALLNNPESRKAMADALAEAGRNLAFTAGLELLPPFEVELESPTHQAQRIEEMQRTLAERRVAGQVEHFERAAALLKQFEELRKAAPDLPAAEILKQTSPADQGMMLQTLLLASGRADRTKTLWAVAGHALVKVDTRATPPSLQSISLPETLGPLRSVQRAQMDEREVLLVGARSGVLIYQPADGTVREYTCKSVVSPLGFSGATVWNGHLWACHGDAGVVAWNLLSNDPPAITLAPHELRSAENPPPLPTQPSPPNAYANSQATVISMSVRTAGIRNVMPLDERRLILSVGHSLITINTSGARSEFPLETHAEVIAIIPDGARVATVQEDGTISLLNRQSLALISSQRRTGRLSAAGTLPWLGSIRLLLATEEGPVFCVGLDDELMTQYTSSHRGLKTISAAPDVVAAISGDRQRIVLWNSWEGKKPASEVLVAAATRHRVGDIEFA